MGMLARRAASRPEEVEQIIDEFLETLEKRLPAWTPQLQQQLDQRFDRIPDGVKKFTAQLVDRMQSEFQFSDLAKQDINRALNRRLPEEPEPPLLRDILRPVVGQLLNPSRPHLAIIDDEVI